MPIKPAPDVRQDPDSSLIQGNSSASQTEAPKENKTLLGLAKELVGGVIERFDNWIQESSKTMKQISKFAKLSKNFARGIPIIGALIATAEIGYILKNEKISARVFFQIGLISLVAVLSFVPYLGTLVGVAYAYGDYKGYIDKLLDQSQKNWDDFKNKFQKGTNQLLRNPRLMFPH